MKEGQKLKLELHNNFDPTIKHLPESSVSKEKNEQGRKYLEHSLGSPKQEHFMYYKKLVANKDTISDSIKYKIF